MTAKPSSKLCVGCGMCCDGTLYDRAKVEAGEEDRMVAAGLELFDAGEKRFFRQPCPHSSCGRCTIYETRFEICHSYDCALLRRVNAGDLGLAEAQDKVTVAKQLLGKAVERDPNAKGAGARKVLRERLAADVAEGGDAAQSLLDIIALDTFLKRWFRLEHEDESTQQVTDPCALDPRSRE